MGFDSILLLQPRTYIWLLIISFAIHIETKLVFGGYKAETKQCLELKRILYDRALASLTTLDLSLVELNDRSNPESHFKINSN